MSCCRRLCLHARPGFVSNLCILTIAFRAIGDPEGRLLHCSAFVSRGSCMALGQGPALLGTLWTAAGTAGRSPRGGVARNSAGISGREPAGWALTGLLRTWSFGFASTSCASGTDFRPNPSCEADSSRPSSSDFGLILVETPENVGRLGPHHVHKCVGGGAPRPVGRGRRRRPWVLGRRCVASVVGRRSHRLTWGRSRVDLGFGARPRGSGGPLVCRRGALSWIPPTA